MSEPMLTVQEVKAEIMRRARLAGGCCYWARSIGASPSYVTMALNDERKIGPKLLNALGLERVVAYRPKMGKL